MDRDPNEHFITKDGMWLPLNRMSLEAIKKEISSGALTHEDVAWFYNNNQWDDVP